MKSVHYIKSQGDHGLGTVFSSRHVNGHDVGYGTDSVQAGEPLVRRRTLVGAVWVGSRVRFVLGVLEVLSCTCVVRRWRDVAVAGAAAGGVLACRADAALME